MNNGTAVALKPEGHTPVFTQDQEKLLLDTVAKGATADEFKLFVYRAQAMGINPLVPGQIHFVKYGNSPGSIIVGIEGFRSIAHRTGMLSGIKRGSIRDDSGKLTGAWAEVYRKDWEYPSREEVSLSEYQGSSPIWRQKPETMIKKVAECAALRMAFPNDLGGVYGEEEAETMKPDLGVLPTSYGQPTETDGVIDGPYRIEFGSYKMRSIEQVCEQIGKAGLIAEIEKREREMAGRASTRLDLTNPDTRAKVQEFIDEASAYIVQLENGGVVVAEDEPEVKGAFEQADSGSLFESKPRMTREELGRTIHQEMKRIKMNNATVATITNEKFKKGPSDLTDSEMESLLEELSRRQA